PLIYGEFSTNKVTINGDLIVTGDIEATDYYYYSDARLKENVATLTDVLTKINQLRGVSFVFIDQDKYASGPQVGVIAQELQAVFPELVVERSNGYLAVNYSQLSAVVLQAVIEQQEEINALKGKVDTLEIQMLEVRGKLGL
ncbi:MAG: tail fiber domain-containing protein, partial [Bacteroidetes bacterium]|nr:tail fiber domain-containing protein [Bacteroidota bacterium]